MNEITSIFWADSVMILDYSMLVTLLALILFTVLISSTDHLEFLLGSIITKGLVFLVELCYMTRQVAASNAWVKSHFTAGKTTTQLSEQFNAFARHYLKPYFSITELLRRFQSLVDDLRHNEKSRDFFIQNSTTENKFKNSLLMIHASLVFTPSIFRIIHNEYEASMGYTFTDLTSQQLGATKIVGVQRWINRGLADDE
ncbi:hypothetical protein LIER_23914 [Lithospermum erythrorhizon]|uniref:Uncharacterized protein n=1 Tax=Lithospermum erythrorhizon TaxID=34254 RepID=A0AAV3QZF2_LITER